MPHTGRRAILATLPLLAAPRVLRAAPGWPTRPVRLVLPFPGGGAADVAARVLADQLSHQLGQPFVVDNRGGAGGNIGAEAVAKAEPDGHTLLFCAIGTASINQFLYRRLVYDPARDFVNVARVSRVANCIAVGAGAPVNDLPGLVELARQRPDGLTYGTPGNGTSGHLCAEYLSSRLGIRLIHVPYRGTAAALTDLVAGRIDLCVDNLPAYLPQAREGRLRLLAVTSAERWFSAPEVPTVAEAGVPDFEAVAWFGVQAPARTQPAIVERLAEAVAVAEGEPSVVTKLREIGSEPAYMGPMQFDRFVAAERAKWQEVVRISGAKSE